MRGDATAVEAPVAAPPLFEARDLVKHFRSRRSVVHAVNGVSLKIPRGRTVGLVGESGSGKSTVARLALRLLEPTSGELTFDGVDLRRASRGEMRALRRRMQIVFQDPLGSLNPRMRVIDAVGEPLAVHRIAKGRAQVDRVVELLERVGLGAGDLYRFSHQFSGGQAQRIGIARALATDPDLIVCDEAVSALDVSVQAQVLNLLKRLQAELGLSYLFIAHDLNVVRYMADEVCVMYLGEIVERGDGDALFADPRHPYTEMLVSAVPEFAPERIGDDRHRPVPRGEPASPSDPPPGCRFHPRCPRAMPRCREEAPAMRRISAGRTVACHLYDPGESGRAESGPRASGPGAFDAGEEGGQR
ncbi:peptide/nickel transport system ATP-binding protein/oligopeptide transport system ATP-binding protein [Thermocatellispora tengchongensis]|uniref:Peptide/nickel transport system ATP-binding protein/oligopeptide transport system ATP-binding protein n=1 Tax=Thermocatellispora tengchongensis TaxID=1073253 RepID=A0A840PI95_9ACTN|nr:ABC transporter ATP-binding protein [Thermocatellispora tengchongensis]MBB5139268.1 peptide/nickel transport system ATP-binding protein/oligopeptide transport system ATP-binding protein [Thermocatellispora tengchongensis]